MLLLRAFPLSLAITWRFLIIIPLWAILYLLMTVLTFWGSFLVIGIAVRIPLIGSILVIFLSILSIAFTFLILIHPYLTAIRIGLNVLGVKTEPSEKRLLGAAAGYGLIQWILNLLLLVIIAAVATLFVGSNFHFASLFYGDQLTDPIAYLSQRISFGSLTVLSAISGFAILALRAAMLPVLANVAAGRDPRGRSYTPAHGFGQGFVTMLTILLVMIILSVLIMQFVSDAAGYVGLTNVLTSQLGQAVSFVASDAQDFTFTPKHAALIAIAIFVSVWLFCLQCAAAALNYENRSIQSPEEKQAIIADQQAKSQEIGDLLRSRMQKNIM